MVVFVSYLRTRALQGKFHFFLPDTSKLQGFFFVPVPFFF